VLLDIRKELAVVLYSVLTVTLLFFVTFGAAVIESQSFFDVEEMFAGLSRAYCVEEWKSFGLVFLVFVDTLFLVGFGLKQ